MTLAKCTGAVRLRPNSVAYECYSRIFCSKLALLRLSCIPSASGPKSRPEDANSFEAVGRTGVQH